ncbi:MAG: GNAT family N-acetyltransferase [Oligoflexia bacterium]|nr:GNAT family N-acetyltransferase [Oligoflexia bacterium]
MELIRKMQRNDLAAVKTFTDRWIGQDYFSMDELDDVFNLSYADNPENSVSFVAIVDDELAGVRLSFAPGKWLEKGRGITPKKWKVDHSKVAYFKSLFVAEKFQAKGLGKKLSNHSIEEIKSLGGEAIVCHSWLESPNNSSQRYLVKMGFEEIQNHEKYWYHIDYECTRCGISRCICTAQEMIKYL